MGNDMNQPGNDQEPWLSRHLAKLLGGIVVIALIAAVTLVSIYHYHLGALAIDEQSPAGWGQLGDYFGGVLNPIFSFLTILALVLTLTLQSRELKLSREELELSRTELRKSAEALRGQNKAIDRQSFEQTFFSWLNTYRELLASIELSSNDEVLRGKRALMRLWSYLLDASHVWSTIRKQYPYLPTANTNRPAAGRAEDSLRSLQEGERGLVSKVAIERWEELYAKYEYQLDSLFRVLYRLIVWIDSQDEERLSPAQKWLYVSIVRAQLSWIELVYLFYNGHTERGKSFKRLAEKYALFDNLNFATDPVIAIVKACPPDTVGYRLSAYESRLARVAMGLSESSEQTLAMASDT
ncbi:MAG: hypothetical protein B7Y41_12715 [Hydrogenophilales bacterium 28-61-23]|nr:MAG: hypothetical protein B7Y41_12715 [Hydrogenophilales bacterium 28-61-23]